MGQYRVVIKRVVSPESRIIGEVKSVAKESGDDEREISQRVVVDISSGSSSRTHVKSSSYSSSKSGSSSVSIDKI